MLLSIIKWIGIVLLILLGLILLILGLVLFVPVRYRAQGSFISGVPRGKAYAGWLFGLLKLDAVYHHDEDQDFALVFRVLGIPVRKYPGAEEEEDRQEASEEGSLPKEPDIRPPEGDELPKEEAFVHETAAADHPAPVSSASHAHETDEQSPAEPVELSGEAVFQDEEKESAFDRFCRRISGTCRDICVTSRAILRVVRQKCEAAAKLKDIYTDSENSPAFKLLKKMLFKVLRELAPKKGSGRLVLGTGDPYTTAQVLEILLLLSPSLVRQMEIVPDFDHEIHDFEGSLRGAVRIGVLLWAAGRVFFNKKIRSIYHEAKEIVQHELLN